MNAAVCRRCEEAKPLTAFRLKNDAPLQPCRECVRIARGKRTKTPEELRACKEYSLIYKRTHRTERSAHRKVTRAVNNGVFLRWPVCALPECEDTRVVAHHCDYSRPLDVVWLCHSHHRYLHNEARQHGT